MEFPMLDKIVSIHREDDIYAPTGLHVDEDPSKLCITFDKLLRDTPFVSRVRSMLQRLEQEYGMPVDVEFACDGEKFYLLQCRTQSQAKEVAPVKVPTGVPAEDVIFDARKYVRSGLLEGLEYVVYVDPAAYDAVPTRQKRNEVARVVGHVNHALPPKSFVLIGPGRWGSNDILLGVPIRYADINRCRLLIEVARHKDGFAPEVSFGTHFFQDLVEADIHYLPLYPDEPGNHFRESFFRETANRLGTLCPDDAEYEDIVRVIHVPAVAGGRRLTVAMDGASDHALAFLK